MDKKSKRKIQELIKKHLEAYNDHDYHAFKLIVNSVSSRYKLNKEDKEALMSRNENNKWRMGEMAIELNNLLTYEDRIKEVIDLEQEMKKIQAKKYINVKEFTEIYGYSSDWQKNRRGRVHDHLPFRQDGHNRKITYVVSDVETWFENNNTGR
ncbi:MAG: hypothetical protein AB7D96_12095 [Arcobacteraceae bacterium]